MHFFVSSNFFLSTLNAKAKNAVFTVQLVGAGLWTNEMSCGWRYTAEIEPKKSINWMLVAVTADYCYLFSLTM